MGYRLTSEFWVKDYIDEELKPKLSSGKEGEVKNESK